MVSGDGRLNRKPPSQCTDLISLLFLLLFTVMRRLLKRFLLGTVAVLFLCYAVVIFQQPLSVRTAASDPVVEYVYDGIDTFSKGALTSKILTYVMRLDQYAAHKFHATAVSLLTAPSVG